MIREVGISDLGRLETAARSFYASSRFLEEFDASRFAAIWAQLLNGGAGVIFSYEIDRHVVGAIGGIVHQDIYGHSIIAEEFFWFIEPKYRGAGVCLYRRFEDWARSRGANSIQMVHLLDLMPDKVGKFYLRQGFEPIETRYAKKLAA